MDIVVRTPHGDADVEIVVAEDTTIADVIAEVTGQASPSIAAVDGRTVDTRTTITDAGVAIGSVIDSRAGIVVDDGAVVDLVQVTGRGAGTASGLAPGRYRVGPGRRVNLPELAHAPVEQPRFELVVTSPASGTGRRRHLSSEQTSIRPASIGPTSIGPTSIRPASIGPTSIGPTSIGEVPVAEVSIVPLGHGPDLRLAGATVDGPVRWDAGRLEVSDRTFELEAHHIATSVPPRPPVYPSGTIAFRRPSRPDDLDRVPLRSARLDAAEQGPGLWHRRSTDPDGHRIPVALDPLDRIVSVDLRTHQGVALVGDEAFSTALARTMLCEAATLHGPADLRIAIASSARRLPLWEWAKWLPHARTASGPALLSEPASISAWAAGRGTATTGSRPGDDRTAPPRPGGPAPTGPATMRTAGAITLLVLDDLTLWSTRESPLRQLLTAPPADLRLIALCRGLHEAPGVCTTLVESDEDRPGFAILHERGGGPSSTITDLRPALADPALAEEIARDLAPLDDLEIDHIPPGSRPLALAEWFDVVLGLEPLGPAHVVSASGGRPRDAGWDAARGRAIAARWAASDDLTVCLGVPASERLRSGELAPLTVDLAAAQVTLVESAAATVEAIDARRLDDVVATLVYGAAIERAPSTLSILTIGTAEPEPLPHLAGHLADRHADGAPGGPTPDQEADPIRLVRRIAQQIEDDDRDVLVVVRLHADRDDRLRLVSGLVELTRSLRRAHLVVATDDPDLPAARLVRQRAGAHVVVGTAGVSTVALPGTPARSCTPPTIAAAAAGTGVIVRPAVVARPFTPLERRIARRVEIDDDGTAEPSGEVAAIAEAVRRAALASGDLSPGPSLVPPPLPATVDATELFARQPGDAIPLGLLDRPERSLFEPLWWEPGTHLVAIAPPRSGVGDLVEVLLLGIAERFSADDVHVYAVEAIARRRRAVEGLPHCGGVVSPDDGPGVETLIGHLERLVDERLDREAFDGPSLVLVVDDLGRTGRNRRAPADLRERLIGLTERGTSVGFTLVALAPRVDDAGRLVDEVAGELVVSAGLDAEEGLRLGLPAVDGVDRGQRHTRRCWARHAERWVQLARVTDPIDETVARLPLEPADQRPPAELPEIER